jgi:uncharacterized membrane protein
MALTPRPRKLALTAHVTASVGWLGAVIAFLALSVTGRTSQDPQTVRGAYLVMERTGWVVLVPLSLASLLTGLISSLGSTWGLFRHYWVLFKLAINLVATTVLLLYTQTLAYLADVAAATTLSSRELEGLRDPSPTLHAAAALVLLLAATTLAIYKPRGVTRYGQRKRHRQRTLLVP